MMDGYYQTLKVCVAGIGVWVSVLLGGIDELLIVLLALSCADYITGVMNAIVSRQLYSACNFSLIYPSLKETMLGWQQ